MRTAMTSRSDRRRPVSLLARDPSARERPRRARRGPAPRQRLLFQPEPSGGPARRHVRDGAPRVLVVDDERSIRTICRINLEAAGLEVLEANDGGEALELISAERPSLVLLDVMMPGVDGWGVAARLAAEAETRDLPVVFLSARASADDRRQAADVGAVGYIVKPFDPLELGAIVEHVLERVERGERDRLRDELLDEG